MITHIFLPLRDTLLDGARARAALPVGVARVLSTRYGGGVAAWQDAYMQVRADWDSYYADLDIGGDGGVTDYFEGLLRTTRALFRLTNTPVPPDVAQLSRALNGLALLQPDTDIWQRPLLNTAHRLRAHGYALGVVDLLPQAQLEALNPFPNAPCFGVDDFEQYGWSAAFWLWVATRAQADVRACAVVSCTPLPLKFAQRAGITTINPTIQADWLNQLLPR
jgi:hypothetical protein